MSVRLLLSLCCIVALSSLSVSALSAQISINTYSNNLCTGTPVTVTNNVNECITIGGTPMNYVKYFIYNQTNGNITSSVFAAFSYTSLSCATINVNNDIDEKPIDRCIATSSSSSYRAVLSNAYLAPTPPSFPPSSAYSILTSCVSVLTAAPASLTTCVADDSVICLRSASRFGLCRPVYQKDSRILVGGEQFLCSPDGKTVGQLSYADTSCTTAMVSASILPTGQNETKNNTTLTHATTQKE